LDATIAGQLCELGLIHLAQAKAYNYRGNNLVAETTKETSAAAPQAEIAQDQLVAELEDKVQALTAQLETLHKNEQRVPTDGQAVVTEQDLLDAMGQAQVKITNAREEAEAAMDAKLASEAAKLNNGVDEQLAAMQRKITEMEATIRDLKTKGASGLMAGVPARPSKRNAGSVATGDEGRPSKRAHGSRSGFSLERRREDESPDTPSGQKGKASGTKSWFP
jgi:polyhydroxyalkanoate synthesis regulator phasin